MDESTTVKELKEITQNFCNARGWGGKFENPKDIVMALSVEASELLEIFQWVHSDDASKLRDNPKEFEHIKEEVADVFWYLMSFCDHFDIDLTEAVIDKEKKNSAKMKLK